VCVCRDPESVQGAYADFQQIPAPRGLPLVGTSLALMMRGSAAQLHKYVDARHAQLGPIYRETIGPVEALFVADPTEMLRVFQREGKYPRHLLPDAWQLYNQLYGCKRGLFFM
jgi:ecdysteroid 2-hydroxylase